MKISEMCRKQLEAAETRVEILIKRAGEVTAEPFSAQINTDKG
jgi:exonuclease VII small subunit